MIFSHGVCPGPIIVLHTWPAMTLRVLLVRVLSGGRNKGNLGSSLPASVFMSGQLSSAAVERTSFQFTEEFVQ